MGAQAFPNTHAIYDSYMMKLINKRMLGIDEYSSDTHDIDMRESAKKIIHK